MDKVTTDSITYGSTVIEYSIEYAQRKTLGILVNPDGSVILKVPYDATLEKVREKVHKRAAWILKQQRHFESFGIPTEERRYVNGESHLYLGRQYMLRIKCSDKNAVHYQNNIIEIECKTKEDAGTIMQKWYRCRAEIKFAEYAKPIIEKFSAYDAKPENLKIRRMEKRWGFCTTNGTIYLNPRLICASRGCIEYVITHEMCHLVHRNHTKEFYSLLSKEMPHWERWKAKLERMLR